jgi:hypothetical protein
MLNIFIIFIQHIYQIGFSKPIFHTWLAPAAVLLQFLLGEFRK